jgi:hypothetical protein
MPPSAAHYRHAARLANCVQLLSDALTAYVDAVERSFGADVDYR